MVHEGDCEDGVVELAKDGLVVKRGREFLQEGGAGEDPAPGEQLDVAPPPSHPVYADGARNRFAGEQGRVLQQAYLQQRTASAHSVRGGEFKVGQPVKHAGVAQRGGPRLG